MMIKEVILKGDTTALENALKDHPGLANQPISFGPSGKNKVHPIHYVCDCIFEKKLEESVGLQLVDTLLAYGADVNGQVGESVTTTSDTPLIAASSLYCDRIALLLINKGADLLRRGTHGGTCLHWAAWTGAETVVEKLLEEGGPVNDQNDEFKSTPLLWAINGWVHSNPQNHRRQLRVMELLLRAGADPNVKDGNGRTALDILSNGQYPELVNILNNYGAKRS